MNPIKKLVMVRQSSHMKKFLADEANAYDSIKNKAKKAVTERITASRGIKYHTDTLNHLRHTPEEIKNINLELGILHKKRAVQQPHIEDLIAVHHKARDYARQKVKREIIGSSLVGTGLIAAGTYGAYRKKKGSPTINNS